ncbi:hypothetical protein PMIN01_05032 [Paraphaeosphaeria minitans]|uniref:Secreted protein n=1 Tax=Paraphaeosphaeria minitans TaxID=565426 RepID=A0A9P6GKX3_9PLEO|nr:hypothetical protein PMIN01_05032 [Paraphaeosphaeria minitans]
MRHPAAPAVIAFLLGLLAFFLLWGKLRGDGHHEGNPHPDDVPPKVEEEAVHAEGSVDDEEAGEG